MNKITHDKFMEFVRKFDKDYDYIEHSERFGLVNAYLKGSSCKKEDISPSLLSFLKEGYYIIDTNKKYTIISNIWKNIFEEEIPNEVYNSMYEAVLESAKKRREYEEEQERKEQEFLNKKLSEMTAKELLELEERKAKITKEKMRCKGCEGKGELWSYAGDNRYVHAGVCTACNGKGY